MRLLIIKTKILNINVTALRLANIFNLYFYLLYTIRYNLA